MDRLDILHASDANGVGLFEKRALIFVRRSTLRVEALDVIEKTVRTVVPLAAPDRPCGAILVVPGDAGLSRNDLLTRQRKIFADPLGRQDVFVAFTVLGDGAQAATMRAVVRLFALSQTRMKMFARTEMAVEWIAPRLKMPAEKLLDAVRSVEAALSSR